MGRQPHDRDFVVVGSSVKEMLSFGYKQVGSRFPVFLHSETKEEYALARTEKKTGVKHTDFSFDFSPEITLYQDCLRRDFTCNALALDEETGEITDFFGGKEDISNKIIRIIDKDNFKLDPLRILRAFRFAAVLGFEIEPETKEILRQMVADGMLQYLSPERVWAELEKVLQPVVDSAKFFEGLAEINALHQWFPELERLVNTAEQKKYHASENTFKHTMCALTRVREDNIIVKFAVLCHDVGKGITPESILPHHSMHEIRGLSLIRKFCNRLRVPKKYKDFALMFCKEHMKAGIVQNMKISKQFDFIRAISGRFQRSEYVDMFLRCFYADYYGEWVPSEYCNDEQFRESCEKIREIFGIMKGMKLKKLPEEDQKMLSEYEKKEFGEAYRQCMIKYLLNHLSDNKDDTVNL